MSRSGSTREFLRRSRLVVGSGLVATFGLLYALSAVGRSVGAEALAAAGLAFTFLNIVSVVGAGNGIRTLQSFFSAGSDREDRLQAVRSCTVHARDASVVLVAAWSLAGVFLTSVVAQSPTFFGTAWLVTLPGFALAPIVAVNSSLMQLADQESRILRYVSGAVLLEIGVITLVVALNPTPVLQLSGMLLASQFGTVGILVSYRKCLRRHDEELWTASRMRGGAWFDQRWFEELKATSFTAWDALAIMGYYALAVSIAGAESAQTAAVVALVASLNRAIIVPLKQAGLVGGRLVRQEAEALQSERALEQTRAVAIIMFVVGLIVIVAGQFSEPLTGIPRSAAAAALAIGGCQLLLEPWVGFASGQGKVLYDTGFGVKAICLAVWAVGVPLMLLLVVFSPVSPVTFIFPFVVARAVALVLMARERQDALQQLVPA